MPVLNVRWIKISLPKDLLPGASPGQHPEVPWHEIAANGGKPALTQLVLPHETR